MNARKAIALQRALAGLVSWEGRIDRLKNIVGLDLAYVKNTGIAVAALVTYPDLELREYVVVMGEVNIPYIPGLLAFREAPLMFKAYEKLGVDADLIMVDGHGVTHPRGVGIASHLGVVLERPSIGAAKKILAGRIVMGDDGREYIEIGGRRGALVVRRGRKTVYLSVGHMVSISEIVRLSATLFKGNHPLPEPTWYADYITKRFRRSVVGRK